jgi:hypothetical protein
MENHELSKPFIKELAPKHAVIVQCGVRYSGKSLWSCALLRYLMTNTKIYDEYHLVIPTWKFQAKGTFKWIESLDKSISSKITIYEDFSLNVVSNLLTKGRRDSRHRYLYLDDATSFSELFSQSEVLKDLITKARHYKITTHIITHHLKAVMIPLLRSNVSYYILHRNVNAKFLEGIYEENLSLFFERKDWIDLCRREMRKDYPALAIDRDRQRIDCNAMDWDFIKTQRDILLKHDKIVYNDTQKVHKDDTTKNGCGARKCTHRVQQSTCK